MASNESKIDLSDTDFSKLVKKLEREECFKEKFIPFTNGLNYLETARVDRLEALIMELRHEGFIPALKEPALDVGMGEGIGVAVLKNLGLKDVYGIDIKKERVKKVVENGILSKDHAKVGDASELVKHYGRENFNLVTAFNAPISLFYFEISFPYKKDYSDRLPYKPIYNWKEIESLYGKINSGHPIRKSNVWLDQVLPSAVDVLKPNGTMIISVMTELEAKDIEGSLAPYRMTSNYKRIAKPNSIDRDAFIYVGKKT